MSGFFAPNRLRIKLEVGKNATCATCGTYVGVRSPRMPAYGNFKLGILNIGEAPGCVTGDSLIEVAYRDKTQYRDGIQIADLVGQSGFYVYSIDLEKQKLVLGRVNRVWKTGRKQVYRVTFEWWHAMGYLQNKVAYYIDVTANHPFLLKKRVAHDPFAGIVDDRAYVSIADGLTIGHSLQPFLRSWTQDHIGISHKDRMREAKFLLECKLGRPLTNHENCHHKNENHLDDDWDNLELLTIAEHARYHLSKNNPMNNPVSRERHATILSSDKYRSNMRSVMKAVFTDPKIREAKVKKILASNPQRSETVRRLFQDPNFYYRYLVGKQFEFNWSDSEIERRFHSKFPNMDFPPIENHKVISIEPLGIQDVYDMEVDTYHNFAVNGIFVHNSFEDASNRPWQGKMGQALQLAFRHYGIDLFDDCLNINAISCRPMDKKGNNRPPTNTEITACRVRVMRTIMENRPKVINLFGNYAVQSVIGQRWKKDLGKIGKWRGWTIPDRELQAWLCPQYHPSFVERGEPEITTIWMKDLERALKMYTVPFPVFENESSLVQVLRDENLGRLEEIGSPFVFDLETTGLKPHNKEVHRIICMGVYDGKKCFAFMMTEAGMKAAHKLLRSRRKKINQNMKFEHTWIYNMMGFEVPYWIWDPMLATHVLDNRSGICGLKFQAYINFGVIDYDSEIDPFKGNPEKVRNANALNRLNELIKTEVGRLKLLIYCGLDTIYTFRLATFQMETLGYDPYNELVDSR